jgi:ubiquinone biosynthesis protein UbiJ
MLETNHLSPRKALYDTWRHLDLDFEGKLANVVGNNIASGISKSVAQSHHWLKKTINARVDDLGAYLQDEKQWLPTRIELEDFFNEVDSIRLDVERIAARIDLLLAKGSEGK